MFRHPAAVLMLDGRQCIFLSKSQPEVDGSILAEFDYPEVSAKNRLSNGIVRSSLVEIESGLYKVTVELESAQSLKIRPREINSVVASVGEFVTPAKNQDEKKLPPVVTLPVPSPASHAAHVPVPVTRSGSERASLAVPHGPAASVHTTSSAAAEMPFINGAVAAEVTQQIKMVKESLRDQLEKSILAALSEKMEEAVGRIVETRLGAQPQNAPANFNAELGREIGERIAQSEELRASIESLAKELFADQSRIAQSARTDIEQELASRANTIVQSLESSIGRMEARITAAPAQAEQNLKAKADDLALSLTASLVAAEDRAKLLAAQLENEMNLRMASVVQSFESAVAKKQSEMAAAQSDLSAVQATLQPMRQEIDAAMQQLRGWEQGSAEIIQKQARAGFLAGAAHFEKQLQAISAEKAETFVRQVEAATQQLRNLQQSGLESIQKQVSACFHSGSMQLETQLENLSGAHTARFATEVEATMQQSRDFQQSSLASVQKQVNACFQSGSMELESHLKRISSEQAAQFADELEQRWLPFQERATETLNGVGAALQLLQGSVRTQQQRLSEQCTRAASEFEAEIKAVLLRLAESFNVRSNS